MANAREKNDSSVSDSAAGASIAAPGAHTLEERPGVTIIVPVHNGGAAFHKCLMSLSALSPAPLEVIVVVDAGTDGSADLARQAGFTVLRLDVQGGPARARNYGARHAKGDVLYFVDADVTVMSDAIARITDALHASPDVAALIGSYDDQPGERNFLSQYKNLMHHYVHQTSNEDASTFWGACGAVRKSAFLSVGGFDESFVRPSIEDIELGYRLRAAGLRIRLVKSLQVKHLKHWGVVSLLHTDFFRRALPWTRLLLERRQFNNDLNLKGASRASVALAWMLVASLAGALWQPWLLCVSGAAATILLILNASLYRFFYQERGLWFMLATIWWHLLYYLYSGLAFGIGLTAHWLGGRGRGRQGIQSTDRSRDHGCR